MKSSWSSLLIIILCLFCLSAKHQRASHSSLISKEMHFLDQKYKKDLADRKLTSAKKFFLMIVAAREFRDLNQFELSHEYYRMARDLKTDENKSEVYEALKDKRFVPHPAPFYFDININQALKNKNYEKVFLSLNPKQLERAGKDAFKILYDLLNVKIRKKSVKKLYCYEDWKTYPEDYQYSNLLCELLDNYLKNGKISRDQYEVAEEYFFKHDLKERYLLQIANEL